jgi:hypothetical protein
MLDAIAVFLAVLLFLTVGMLVPLIYLWLKGREPTGKVPEGERYTYLFMTDSERLRLELEYNTLNRNVDSRGEQTLVTGTIILVASVLILIESLNGDLSFWLRFSTVFVSLALYAGWLFAYATTRRLDDICCTRMREIESDLGIQVHLRLWKKIQGKSWYRFGRSIQWLVFFWILLFLGLIIVVFK